MAVVATLAVLVLLLAAAFLIRDSVTAYAVPANDDFSAPTTVGALPYTNSISTVGATRQEFEPLPSCQSNSSATVWYEFTPSISWTYSLDTEGSDFDTVLAIYTGSWGLLSEKACDDDSGTGLLSQITAFSFLSGTTYHIQVGGYNGDTGSLTLNLDASHPPNDNFANAFTVGSLPYTRSQVTTFASREGGEPLPSCQTSSGATVWYGFTPAISGTYAIDTAGSGFDTVLAVHTGSWGALSQVACDDDVTYPSDVTSRVYLSATGGTDYRIQVSGFSGLTGSLKLNVSGPTATPTPPPTLTPTPVGSTPTTTPKPTPTSTLTPGVTPTPAPTPTPTATPVGPTPISTPKPTPTATAPLENLITFEETIPSPDSIRSQYCNNPSTNKGVEFLAPSSPFRSRGGRIFVPSVTSSSPTHALTTEFPGMEFEELDHLAIRFTEPQTWVSVNVGLNKSHVFDVTAFMRAYSSDTPGNGQIMFSAMPLGKGPTPITNILTVFSATANIRSIDIEFTGPGGGGSAIEWIDDLSYSAAGPPCIADITGPSVVITLPTDPSPDTFNPVELAFTASDAGTGVATVQVSFVDSGGADIQSFYHCGGPVGGSCLQPSSPSSPLTADFLTYVPKGTSEIRVTAWDFVGHSGLYRRSVFLTEPPVPTTNIWVQGMEITQAIQPWVARSSLRRKATVPEISVPSSSSSLVAGKTTYVRVYPGLEGAGGVPVVAQATMTCTNTYFTPCPAPLLIGAGNLTIDPADNNDLTTLRRNASKTWNFELPDAWTRTDEPLRLTVKTFLPGGLWECPGCRDGANSMMVSNVWFRPTGPLKITPIWACVRRSASDGKYDCDESPLDAHTQVFQYPNSLFVQTYPVAEEDITFELRSANWVYMDGNFGAGGAMTSDKMQRLMNTVCGAVVKDAFAGTYPGSIYFGFAPGPTTAVSGLGRPGGACAVARFAPGSVAGDTATAAQEVGHVLGFNWHASCDHNEGLQSAACLAVPSVFPCDHGGICAFGFGWTGPFTFGAVDPGSWPGAHTHDFMSYGGGSQWVSTYVYERLFDIFRGALFFRTTPAEAQPQQPPEDVLWVGGTISLEETPENPTRLDSFYHLTQAAGPSTPGAGEFSLELQDGSGGVLYTRSFDVVVDGAHHPDPGVCCGPVGSPEVQFFESLPFDPGIADNLSRIVLKRGTDVLAERVRSASPPSVELLSPQPGAQWGANETRTVSWTGSDPDGDQVYYLVQYSTDGGATWSSAAEDWTASSLEMDTSRLAGSDNASVRVLATDGVNTAVAQSGVFTVAGKAPIAWITRPSDEGGATPTFPRGQRVILEGNATDWEDGPLPGGALTWLSNLDGLLGTGRSLETTTLSPGVHEVSLEAEDSDGQSGDDVISIEIVATINSQPTADAGPDQATGKGTTVLLDGTWSSDVDNDPLTFYWTVVGQPAGGNASLTDPEAMQPDFVAELEGDYEIELIVNDGHVISLSDSVRVSVSSALMKGDANCDGSINPVDSLTVLRYDAGLPVTPPEDCILATADVNCDGEVNPVDSLGILRFDAGLPVSQPDGCPLLGAAPTAVVVDSDTKDGALSLGFPALPPIAWLGLAFVLPALALTLRRKY